MLADKNNHGVKNRPLTAKGKAATYAAGAFLTLLGLEILSAYNYLLFHTTAEVFSIVIAGCVFIIAWNSRSNLESNATPLLGLAFISIAVLDGVHTLSYKGMPFFPGYAANLPTQLWIAGRYLQAISMLAFVLLTGKRFSLRIPLITYTVITVGVIVLVFTRTFPDCYLPGQGLTPFKIGSEYLISFLLLGTMAILYKNRRDWDDLVYRLIMFSLAATILAELAFTFYISVYGISNLIGHYFKILSFYLIYKSVVVTGISRPQAFLFRQLNKTRKRYLSLTRNIHGIIFRRTVNFRIIYIRGEVQEITGYTVDDFQKDRTNWAQIIHPRDLAKIKESRAQRDLLAQPGYSTSREYRILKKDGELRWIHETIHNIPEVSGEAAYVEGVLLDVTERKEAEESASKQANLLKSILGAIQESAILLDGNGKVLQANSTAAQRLQTSRDKLLGCGYTDLLSPDRARRTTEMFREVREKDRVLEFEEIQNSRITENRIYPVKDSQTGETVGVTILGLDITERKKRENELNKLRLAVENSPMSIVITDTQGTIEYINPAFVSITGYSEQESMGQNPRILKSGYHGHEFYQEMWETITRGDTWRGEICNKRKNGDLYWEQAAIGPVKDEKGAVTNYVAVKEDISRKKELEQLKQDVERIMRHDLKSPLNGIVGLPQVMNMEGNLTSEQVEMLNSIEQSGRKMLNMINLSLDMFRMETGSYDYQPTRVDALTIVNQLITDNRSKLTGSNLECRVLLDGEPLAGRERTLSVWSEERLLYTLLSNLYLNALEASPQGEEIRIDIYSSPTVSLCISNRGAVPAKIKDRFFEKYVTFGKNSGTGLGTYSAKLIADTLGYTLELSTSEDKDTTTICIYIPGESPSA